MKVVRRYATAARLAGDNPVIQIIGPKGEKIWVVFNGNQTPTDIKKTEIAIIRQGKYCGHVKLKELDRLGDANECKSEMPIIHSAFPNVERKRLDGKEETATE